MNKKYALTCAISVAAAFVSLTCHAQSQVQIYGTIDAAVGRVDTQPPGAPNAPISSVTGVHNGALQTSYFGFRGTEDLGGGLSAKFQMEGFFRADTGQSGRFDASAATGVDNMWSRETYVGLSGGFGEVRLGVNATPAWVAMLQSNALGANSVFSPSFRQLFNGGTRGLSEVDTAMVNSVRYLSPNFGGLEGSLVVQPSEGAGSTSYGGNLAYRSGPVFLTAAISRVRHAANPNVAGVRDQTLSLVGGAYNFGPVKVFGQYTNVNNPRLGTTDKLPHFGVSAPLGSGELQFSTGTDKKTGTTISTRTTTSLGYVYNLSKRTDLYTFAMSEKLPVGTGNSYVVGIRHRF